MVSAYLEGLKVREARESRIAEAEARVEANKLRAQQIADAWNKFQTEHKLNERNIDSQIEARDSQNKARDAQTKNLSANLMLTAFKASQNGDLSAINNLPPEAKEIIYEKMFPGMKGFYDQFKPQTTQEVDQREINKAGGIATAQSDARLPAQREMAILQGNIQASNQGQRLSAQAIENEKNRVAARENALIRANATRTNKAATLDEKKAADNDAIEAHLPDIYTGQVALEDIPKGDIGVKIQSRAKKDGTRIFKKAEIEKFNANPALQTFIDNIKAYNEAIRNGNLLDARNRKNALQADLGLFGRNTKGERGNLSNQDIARIGELLPGIMTFDQKENDRRVKEIENIYFNAMDQAFRGMNPVQRKAVEDRWEIRRRPITNAQGQVLEEIE